MACQSRRHRAIRGKPPVRGRPSWRPGVKTFRPVRMGSLHWPQLCPRGETGPKTSKCRRGGDGDPSPCCSYWQPAVDIGVLVLVHHSPGPARRASGSGMAESADLVPGPATRSRPCLPLDIDGRSGDRLCRRSGGTEGRGVCVRRLRGSYRRWRLLELVCVALGTEPLVAMGPGNSVRVVYRSHFPGVLHERTDYQLPEAKGSPIRVCSYADPAHLPFPAFGLTVKESGRGRPTWRRLAEIPTMHWDCRPCGHSGRGR